MGLKRIEYIDLMKGICIILIILLHSSVGFHYDYINDMLKNMRIPLYFCLSGLFFKEYNGFCDFIVRKFNKLIIPYIFFAYFPFALCELGLDYERSIKSYLLMGIEPFNYPLWFLRCLFITYILYYIFSVITKRFSIIIRSICVFIIGFCAYESIPYLDFSFYRIYIIDNVITAFVALPLFYIASTIKQKGLLSQAINKKQLIILFILFFTVWALTFQENIDYESIHFGKNFIFLYLSALGGISCVWCVAYIVKRIFYISYVGRYSLIALGTHYPLILLFKLMGIDNKYLIALCVLLVMPGVIWVFKRYFPYFTAQKDLIVYEDGKLKLHLNRKN